MPAIPRDRAVLGKRTGKKSRNAVKRAFALEALESRTLLTFTFVYTNVNLAVVNETGPGNDSFTVANDGTGLLEWSTDHGVTFSTQWGAIPADTLNADPATSLTINSAGNNSDVILGISTPGATAASSASAILAKITLGPNFSASNGDRLTIDDSLSNLGDGTYTNSQTAINTTHITGPLGDIDVTASPGFTGGATIIGSGADNIFNVPSVYQFQPLNIIGNAHATVNIGSTGGPGVISAIQGAISVTNPASLTDLVFHDENDTTGQTWTLNNDDTVPSGSVGVTGSATTSYNPLDLASLTVNAGSGGNTFNVNGTSDFFPTTLNTGTGDDTTNVFATGSIIGNTLDIHGQQGQDTVILGADPIAGMQNLLGTISVDNDLGFTDLTLDDSADTTGQTALLFNDGTDGQVTGLSPATINYVNDDTSSLTVFGGSGGNTFTVDGTINNIFLSPVLTSLNTGFGDDTTFVEATAAGGPLNVHGQAGQDAVLIGSFGIGSSGSLAGILGTVTVDNDFEFTDLTVDASADLVSHDFTLSSSGPQSTLTALAPADIIYTTGDTSSLTINTNAFGNQVMNIDMSGGNPIPFVNTPGLTFNAGADFGTAGPDTHALNIFGALPTGPFASETHNANDHSVFPQVGQYGSIFFDDGQALPSSLTSINYTGLLPIADTTPAIDYTFNDFADDQSFSATDGPIVLGFQTLEFANTPITPPPTFETTDIANKNFVTFNTPGPTSGIIGLVNVPIASDGLLSLTFNTPTGGDNTVSFVNTPPGVVSALNGGNDEDVTNVTGLGVADGTVLFLNGGASTNTLNYDAGGETPTITPGLLPGEVLITIPGAGIVDAVNYQIINITDAAPIVITPGPPVTINTVEGFQNVDAIVGTFTAPIGILPAPGGFPASDFTASIDWGDLLPSDPDAGKITQDASNPSVYFITGTHTFLENGTFTVSNTVAFAGGTFTVPVNGVPITINFGPAGPTAGTDATANVTQGPLVVSALPVVGTEGIAIPAGPIATFIDAGGADIGAYTASISIFDSGGNLVVGPIAATSIDQNADANQFTVNAPSFTLPEEGTYQVVVSVTDSGGVTPITVDAASFAVIADAPLTAGPSVIQNVNTGVVFPFGFGLGSFTDANLGATASDFIATIDWGDGSPNSVGIVSSVGPAGAFDVIGLHTYARAGSYTATTNILDVGGSTTTLFASFTITDLPVTGSTNSFTATEGQNTGTFVLATFEDPNTLATLSDVHAELAIGGWGDGTPTVAGIRLTVQQIGVDPANGEPIFQVLGSHTYAEETPPGLPDTLSVIITTAGGATTTLTSPPGGGVTVLDAKLTGSSGNSITGVEGSTTGSVLLGTFVDANQGATVADFTTGTGIVLINWGDGSAPLPLDASNLSAVGSPNGVTWTITAAHTYTEEGTYSYTITVQDDGGSFTTVSGTATIADAALTAGAATLLTPNTGVALPSSTVVATFTDANTFATTADFIASIDWGDGSPASTGTLVATATPGLFNVEGGHTYAKPGTFITKVTVIDDGGSQVVITGSSTVVDLPVIGATKNFTAVEGKDTGLFVLATFTTSSTKATVADVTAELAIGGWGDGSPTVGGITLVVQQIGVTPLTSATNPGSPIFEVLGSHLYTEETPAGLPDTLSVIITTLGGVQTTLTSPPGGGVTVLDAQLTSSNGTTISGIEGITTGTELLGTFTDANQGATTADFLPTPGGNGGSVVVNWGDGSAPETFGAGNLAAVGSPNGVIFTVRAAHIYAEEGTFAYNVTVTDDGGAVTIFSGAAVISDAAISPSGTQPNVSTIEASLFPIPVFGKPGTGVPTQGFAGPVASFTDADPTSPLSDFTAIIDWGDGTPMTAGTVSQPGGVGTAFIVSGSHIYADAGVNGGIGTYAIQVFIVDVGGSRLLVTNTANVADIPITLTGILNPTSDTGLSTGTINTTSDKQPDFFGNSEPLSHITLFAALLPGGAPVQIGQVAAGSDGAWDIESRIALADGHYAITATAVDQFGVTTTVAPTVITPDLLIDTHGPVITGLFFNRINGQVDYTIQDPGGAPSGVWIASLLDSSNYQLSKVHPEKNFPGRYFVSNVTVSPDPAVANAFDVAVQFNAGRTLRGGFYLFQIRDSSNGDASVQDLAENHLDGEFYGTFPSGNHINGGDFIAELQAYHNKVFAPQTIIGTANAANGGVGGNRVGAVHSGTFVPIIPRGGAPIFSTPTSSVTAAKKSKTQLKIKVKQAHSLAAHHASTVKHALVVGKKVPKGIHGHS